MTQPKFNSREATLAAITARYQSELQLIRIADKRMQNTLKRTYEARLAECYEQIGQRTRALDKAETKVDELDRLVQRLQYDNAERQFKERQAVKDMQHLAAKVLTLHSAANTRLNPSTAAIFARRGWNTEMGRS